MQRFILRMLLAAGGVLLASYVFPGLIVVSSVGAAVIFAVILGLLNAFLRPILLLLTLPLTLLTLGLFTFVVNALVFWVASLFLQDSVKVEGFGGAFVGALTVSVVSFLGSRAFK